MFFEKILREDNKYYDITKDRLFYLSKFNLSKLINGEEMDKRGNHINIILLMK